MEGVESGRKGREDPQCLNCVDASGAVRRLTFCYRGVVFRLFSVHGSVHLIRAVRDQIIRLA